MVKTATEMFFAGGMGAMACPDKEGPSITRKVFVQLETRGHPLRLDGDRNYAFASQVRGIGKGRGNVLRFERWILIDYSLRRFAGGEIVENDGDGDPRAFEAHGAVHDSRV